MMLRVDLCCNILIIIRRALCILLMLSHASNDFNTQNGNVSSISRNGFMWRIYTFIVFVGCSMCPFEASENVPTCFFFNGPFGIFKNILSMQNSQNIFIV